MEDIAPLPLLLERLNFLNQETDAKNHFAFNCLDYWIRGFNEIKQNIENTSLNREDKYQRQKDLINKILSNGKPG